MRTGIFVGTFDPFTIGHASIVRRALPLFDRLIIGIGINEQKKCMLSIEERLEAITALYRKEPKITVKTYTDLAVNFAHRERAQYIVRGVRTVADFEYERTQADINRRIGNIETLLLFAEPQLESISSSMVRELKNFNRDIKEFIP